MQHANIALSQEVIQCSRDKHLEENALHKQARCLHIGCHVCNAELRGLLRPNGPPKLVALRSVLACRIQALPRATHAAGGYVDAAAIHCQP